ncbi:hypothetical protein VNO77_32886 [Canavalia gladiata]|uniref:Uncharacterized protein n=1 Tax=Canavalia gladiata TaxID=3824 RepID=A0AAN9KDC4_CANGL
MYISIMLQRSVTNKNWFAYALEDSHGIFAYDFGVMNVSKPRRIRHCKLFCGDQACTYPSLKQKEPEKPKVKVAYSTPNPKA